MAEVDKGTAGNKSKQREDSQRRGKSRRKAKKSVSKDDKLTCYMCTKVFVDADDKLLECERCDQWFCTKCVDMTDAVYEIMTDRRDMHWYCDTCEGLAVTAVKTDKDIADRCAFYMKSLTERMDIMDKKIESKADKTSITELESRVKSLEEKQVSDRSGGASASGGETEKQKSDTVRETIEEQKEREFRARNIVIHNLPESEKEEIDERREDDITLVTGVFDALGVTEENAIEKCSRIGKTDEEKTRITIVTLESVQLKRQILKKSRSLKDIEKYEEVFVGPNLTKMQRKEQYLLRKELNERKKKR